MINQDDIVFAYTRAEAIADGVQVELSEKFPEACSWFKASVFCTDRVWALAEATDNKLEDAITDICYVAATEIKRKAIADETRIEIKVSLTGASVQPDSYWNGRPLFHLCGIRQN